MTKKTVRVGNKYEKLMVLAFSHTDKNMEAY